MKASKLFVIVLVLFQGQFIKAQCDTIALKKDLTFRVNSELKKRHSLSSDTLYVETCVPIFQLKHSSSNDSLKNFIDFSNSPENQAFIAKNSEKMYSGYFVKDIEDKRELYDTTIWYNNQNLPIKATKEDFYIAEGFNLFEITNYEKFIDLIENETAFFIYDVKGMWILKDNELIHIQENNGSFAYSNGQTEFEKILQENEYDCFKLLIDGWLPCGRGEFIESWLNCGKDAEIIFFNPNFSPPPKRKIRKQEKCLNK